MRYVRSVQSVNQLVDNQKNCEAIKKNTLERKNKKEARTEGSAFCFVAVISERKNDGAEQRSNFANT